MTFFALIVREANIRILLARYLAQTVVLESMDPRVGLLMRLIAFHVESGRQMELEVLVSAWYAQREKHQVQSKVQQFVSFAWLENMEIKMPLAPV
jgi:hypothetical protein